MSQQSNQQMIKRSYSRATWHALTGSVLLAVCGCASEPDGTPALPGASLTPSGTLAPGGVPNSMGTDPVTGLAPGGSTSANPSAGPSSGEPVGTGGPGPVAGTGGAGPVGGGGEGPGPAVPGGAGAPVDPATPPVTIETATDKVRLRLLTQREYLVSVTDLLQLDAAPILELPDDTSVAGFSTVGASDVTVSELAAEEYGSASEQLAIEVFSDEQRWPTLVGCSPQPDLSDACVETYVSSFGRRAFRRDLTEIEVSQWVGVARAAAGAAQGDTVTTGLAVVTAGLLQSPNFLYRFEYASPDLALGRIKFDGLSMATRLSYLATGSGPDQALLDAAAAGQLDTPDGVRQAAVGLFAGARADAFTSEFFSELSGLQQVPDINKDTTTFPDLTLELRASMQEEAQRWLQSVVLAPQADVRSFFDSTTTYVDPTLAQFYGMPTPASGGFEEVILGPEVGRSGILGKAGFLLVHSSADSTNPTRRGKYIVETFYCTKVPPPNITVTVPKQAEGEAPKTTRELFEQHRIDATCVTCHSVMDPFGFALEHFDAIGAYRETENGLTIDATGEFQGATFDGAVELGTTLRNAAATSPCFIKNLYRYANGTADDQTDATLITGLAGTLAERNYVWRDLLVDFAASDAFTSLAPTVEE